MSVYTKVGDLTIHLQEWSKSVTPFDRVVCEFHGFILLDTTHLLSGAKEALKAVLNCETKIGSMHLRFSGRSPAGTPFAYDASEEQRSSGGTLPVIAFAARIDDPRRGTIVPFVVRVPRQFWPEVGMKTAYSLTASATVEFLHLNEQRVEQLPRRGSTGCELVCHPAF